MRIRKILIASFYVRKELNMNTQSATNAHENMQQPPSPSKFKLPFPQNRWLRFLVIALLVFVLLNIIFTIWFFSLDISKLAKPMPVATKIYDNNGQIASQQSSTKFEPVTLAHIPKQLREAVVAAEDQRFYQHSGVDVRSIARALWRDIRQRQFAEGGSTITQQLAKNMFLPLDKTLGRKLKEAAYALKIELTYSKDEILMLYLNNIYYGEGQWGIERAAKTYFAKNTDDLTLAESATLAGLSKAPSTYNPLRNKDAALERRNIVLTLMREQNFITADAEKQAEASPMTVAQAVDDKTVNKYADFVDAVMTEASESYGISEGQLLSSGLSIYTTVDPTVQLAAEAVYQDDQFFPASKPDQLIQSGTVIIDQHNGEIRGIVGHRGQRVQRSFNYATKLKRQPGSSFKPLSVYGPALEKGYTPDSLLYDGDLNINGYQPKDYDLQTRGQVTLTEAIAKSWNIPAVWLLHEIGVDAGMEYAARSGIPLTKDDRTLGLALGGLSVGTSPLSMAQAFTGFANLGNRFPAHTIKKILDHTQKVLVDVQPQAVKVTTPAAAYTMTSLLVNAVQTGTGNAALLDRPTAGKTGTTELPNTPEFAGITGSVSKDAWFVGYTPELTAAVWLGYDKTDKTHYLTSSSAAPARIFQEIMSRALQGQPIKPFPVPEGLVVAADKGNQTHHAPPKANKSKPDDHNPARNNGHGKEKRKE
jgi:penicillin-binding protein 2A